MNGLAMLHTMGAIVVLCEAVNKLHRSDLFAGSAGWWKPRFMALAWLCAPWLWRRPHIVDVLKASGWALLAIGAAGHLVAPLIGHGGADLPDQLFTTGFAVLIIRSRVKEG